MHETIGITDIVADQEGYILVYLSNENSEAVNVHFDDFTVYQGKTNLVQTDDYYPFGLTFNSLSRTASTPQNFLLAGNERLPEWGAGMYDFNARMYDASIGRFGAVDPMADNRQESWNPYHYNYNNPVRFNDPTGLMPIISSFEEDYRQAVEEYEEKFAEMVARNLDYYKALADKKWAARTGVDFSGSGSDDESDEESEGDQTSGGTEITANIINGIIDGLPQDGSSGQFIGIAVDLLQKYDNAFIEGSTIRDLVKDPAKDVADVINKINRITKSGNNVSMSLSGKIVYDAGLISASINTKNNISINTLSNNLVELGVSGIDTSLGALNAVEITPSAVKVRVKVGFVNVWKTIVEF